VQVALSANCEASHDVHCPFKLNIPQAMMAPVSATKAVNINLNGDDNVNTPTHDGNGRTSRCLCALQLSQQQQHNANASTAAAAQASSRQCGSSSSKPYSNSNRYCCHLKRPVSDNAEMPPMAQHLTLQQANRWQVANAAHR
jgi:hypothetical protein